MLLTLPALSSEQWFLGAVLGKRVVDRIPERVFEAAVVCLTAGSTLMLFR